MPVSLKSLMSYIAASMQEYIEFVPSAKDEELFKEGAHIKIRRFLYAHHAMVTKVDKTLKKVSVIHFTAADLRNKSSLAVIQENTLSQRDRIRFIRIEDATGDKLYKIQKFPLKVSLAIAAFFKNNNDAFGRYHLLNNNCEHFVYTCTIGWKISLQAMAVYGVQIGRKVYLPRLSSPDDLDDKETIRTNTYKEMQPTVPPTETKLEPYFESNIKDIHKTLYESNVLSQFNQGKDMNVPVCRAERYPLLNLLTGKPTPPDIMPLYGHRVVEYTEGDTFCKVKLKTGDVCLEL